MRWPLLLLLTLALPQVAWAQSQAPATTAADAAVDAAAATTETEDLLPFKLSLPTEEDAAAWQTPGFRMQLGVGFGMLQGLAGTPGSKNIPILVRIGARLDRDWSLFGSFQFAVAGWRKNGDLSGLRFAGTIDPTWHITDHLDLAAGFGFGGLVEGSTGRSDPNAEQRASLVASYTFPSARTPMVTCSGLGVTGNLRATYMWVLGPLSATGFALQTDGQWTACVETVGRVEPDTAQSIVRRQWWANAGGSLTWVISWR
jgi:hypothetical protein